MAISFRNLLKFNSKTLLNKYKNNSINLLTSYKFQNTMSEHKEIKTKEAQKLADVVKMLDYFADTKYAEKWDNVGLLIEPFTEIQINKVMLTNDLTEHVIEEAVQQNINLIVSYHPPIFEPLKRITKSAWKERIVACCLENKIAVYSPHTSWDAVYGGVTDWLADAFKKYESERIAIIPAIPEVPEKRSELSFNDGVLKSRNRGMGIILTVKELDLHECIRLLKSHIGLQHLRITLGKTKRLESFVRKIALVPGSGRSLLKGVEADLYITGEMFHHDLLDISHNDITVILLNHSDSERGFLKKMVFTIEKAFNNKLDVILSERDKDPVTVI